MAVTQEQIEDVYSRIPVLRPPPNVFVLRNAEIGAERLFDMTHSLNGAARRLSQERLRILGMHEMGTSFVTVAGDAGISTVVHEAVHHMGVRNEMATRAITRGLLTRANLNVGLRRRPVHYQPAPVDAVERDQFLTSLHLSNPSGQPVELVHLVYTPGG
jgi:hypothetical protein